MNAIFMNAIFKKPTRLAIGVGATCLLVSGAAFAQAGSAMGDVSVNGDVSIVRDNAANPASGGDVIFDGDTITVGEGDATVNMLEGGTVNIMEESEVMLAPGQIAMGASGGGCFSGLGAPVDIVVDGQIIATGVTSGGVFDGVFYASCEAAQLAATEAGGGFSPLTWAAIVTGTIVVGDELLDDDPVHGS